MTRHGSILDFRWPLSNGNGLADLASPWTEPSAGARMAKVVLPAKLLDQAAFEDAATLHEQTAVYRFRRDLHVSIARKGVSEPARDLLRRPLPGELTGDGTSEWRPGRQAIGLRTTAASPGLPVGDGSSIDTTPTVSRHFAT